MSNKHPRGFHLLVPAAVAAALAVPTAFAGSLSGRVSDHDGIRHLQSAVVQIVELGRQAETGPDGSYRFTDVPDGSYTLRTRYVGAAPAELRVSVAGDTRAADIRLAGVDELEAVLVVGQRASMSSSLSRQRAADGVQSVLSRDGIGQFPDQNVAESLRRVSGINVLNDQGEGRFVAVRGLDPDLNAASINGARVPAPESDVRMVALDVIPSDIIESVEIRKSLTPDMDGDTIGASIQINSTSSLDQERSWMSATAEGSYNDLNDKWSPKAGLNFSTRLTERFGIAGGVSYYQRAFSTDNIEMDGWDETGDGTAWADTVEYRDYDVERTRLGGALSLDYLAGDSTRLFARLLHSKFGDQEYRGRLIFEMDEAPSGGDAGSASFSDADGEIAVIRDLKDRQETQRISSLVLGGQSFAGAWTFDYQASLAQASEKEGHSLDPMVFARDFEADGLGVTFDYSRPDRPAYAITQGQSLFQDPAGFEFDEMERTSRSRSKDRENALQFDIARSFQLASGEWTFQFGGKVRQRRKTFDLQVDVFDGFDGDFTLADVPGRQSYGLAAIDPLPGRQVRRFVAQNLASFERNAFDSEVASVLEDFRVEEDINAGYALGRLQQGPLRMVAGVRVEQTRSDLRGNQVEIDDEAEVVTAVTPLRATHRYTDVLPSVNLRYAMAPDMLLRGSVYASVVRPLVGAAAPRFEIVDEDGDITGVFGNPDLKPFRAWNADLSAEWYLASNGVLQGGLFWKRIRNPVLAVECEAGDAIDVDFCAAGSYQGVAFNEAESWINGERATVKGLELAYQQSLGFLPGAWSGLLLGLNYTFTDARGRALDRSFRLPAAAKNTWNAMLGYEKGPFSLRLTAAHRGSYLDELGGDADEDRWVRSHLQWDLSLKYRVNPNVQVFAEFVNLGDEPYVAYQRGPGRDRLLQYEQYSWTAKTGLRISF